MFGDDRGDTETVTAVEGSVEDVLPFADTTTTVQTTTTEQPTTTLAPTTTTTAEPTPTTTEAPPPPTTAAPPPAAKSDCDPNYEPCIPNVPYDLDCPDVATRVTVIGTDRHGFDRDGDGYGCESYG